MKNTILITGGAGFIGSHLTDAYLNMGYRVVIVDNFSTGDHNNCPSGAIIYNEDITDIEAVRYVFNKEKPKVVNHHAALASVSKALQNPLPTLNTNVIGTTNICLVSGETNISRLIFASTGGVMYGDNAPLPVSEKVPPAPSDPYGLSKLLCEKVVEFYSSKYGFAHIIFRYANVYGPRQNPKGEAGVIAIFSELMRSDKTPTIFGDGTKTRDYVFVEDIVLANIIALEKGDNTILNLGLGKQITDQKIYETIAKEIGFTQKPIYSPSRPNEIKKSALDAYKASRLLGWTPKVKLENGIQETLKK